MSKAENIGINEITYTPSLLRLKRNLFEALTVERNAVNIQNAVDSILAKTKFEVGAEIVANTAYEALIENQGNSK